MTSFKPGKLVKTFKTKNNQKAIIRYPKWEDLDLLLEYINNLSQENTFINYSGEKISKKDEAEFLSGLFKEIELNNKIMLCCFVGKKLTGNCTVERITRNRKRKKHVGLFGIVIAKKHRRQGIGKELAKTTIDEAKKELKGLKLIILSYFSKNKIAKSLYDKIGFQEAGKTPGALLYNNEFIDEVNMYLKI